MHFNRVSTASFVALNKRGAKTCLSCIIGNAKLIQHRFIKYFVFQLGRIGHTKKRYRSSPLSIRSKR